MLAGKHFDFRGGSSIIVSMNRLTATERARILHLLCVGNSIRAVTRLTGASKNTIAKLLMDAGKACAAYHDEHVRNVRTKRVQVDEIWSFTYAKQKNVADAKAAPDGAGDTGTWTAIDADTKLVLSYFIGSRDGECAAWFIGDLKARLATRVQLTSHGHKVYLEAVEGAFGAGVDYAVLQKIYGTAPGGRQRPIQPSRLHRGAQAPGRGQARRRARLHVLRGTPEPHDADAYAPVHAAHERVLEEGRAPRLRGGAALHVL